MGGGGSGRRRPVRVRGERGGLQLCAAGPGTADAGRGGAGWEGGRGLAARWLGGVRKKPDLFLPF
jgi:hypothetical protein